MLGLVQEDPCVLHMSVDLLPLATLHFWEEWLEKKLCHSVPGMYLKEPSFQLQILNQKMAPQTKREVEVTNVHGVHRFTK